MRVATNLRNAAMCSGCASAAGLALAESGGAAAARGNALGNGGRSPASHVRAAAGARCRTACAAPRAAPAAPASAEVARPAPSVPLRGPTPVATEPSPLQHSPEGDADANGGRLWRLGVGLVRRPGRLTLARRPNREAALLVVENSEALRDALGERVVDRPRAERRLDDHLGRLDANVVAEAELLRNTSRVELWVVDKPEETWRGKPQHSRRPWSRMLSSRTCIETLASIAVPASGIAASVCIALASFLMFVCVVIDDSAACRASLESCAPSLSAPMRGSKASRAQRKS